jgi:hypothetical protein
MRSPQWIARLAGGLYLSLTVLSVIGGSITARIIQPENPGATIENIRSSAALFRAGVGLELLSNLCYLATALVLFVLLRHVDQVAATAMVVVVTVATAVGYVNTFNQYTALVATSGSDYIGRFGRPAATAGVLVLANRPGDWQSGTLFFGLWLLPLGYLLIKSRFYPKFVGVMVLVAAGCWLAEFAAYFMVPVLAEIAPVFNVGAIGEFILIAWLLFARIRAPGVDQEARSRVLGTRL